MEELRSWALGTLPLQALLAAAVVASRRRPLPPPRALRDSGLLWVGAGAVALQAAHFAEELLTGFHVAFPTLLGLTPWSAPAFIAFNAGWLLLWTACLAWLARDRAAPGWPLWFLAWALAANGIAHPLLALRVGGYFPGAWTSPLVGVVGAMLWIRLVRVSRIPRPTLRASSGPPASG